jgi:carboxymethylenebutenolidase
MFFGGVWHPRAAWLIGVLCVLMTMSVAAQDSEPALHTWADQQRAQQWAARKLQQSPRQAEWVSVVSQGQDIKAWVDYPSGSGKAPVVLVLHEVFGLTDSTRNTADELSAMGYIAVVPDMLSGLGPHGGGTDAFANARLTSERLTGLDDAIVAARIDAWADYGRNLARSNGAWGIVGLSWGGGAAFRYATAERRDLRLVCVFYDVGPPAVTQGPQRDMGLRTFPVTGIQVPVHGFYASRDARVAASLAATRSAMAAAHKAYDPVTYEGADHAFMRVGEDPADGNPANRTAVEASLARLRRLLAEQLR